MSSALNAPVVAGVCRTMALSRPRLPALQAGALARPPCIMNEAGGASEGAVSRRSIWWCDRSGGGSITHILRRTWRDCVRLHGTTAADSSSMQTMIASLLHRGSDAPHLGVRDLMHDWVRLATSHWTWVRSAKSPLVPFTSERMKPDHCASARTLWITSANDRRASRFEFTAYSKRGRGARSRSGLSSSSAGTPRGGERQGRVSGAVRRPRRRDLPSAEGAVRRGGPDVRRDHGLRRRPDALVLPDRGRRARRMATG
jgi:hypothetical protein